VTHGKDHLYKNKKLTKEKNRKMKKILLTIMACVMALGLVGGAFAYFTDVEYSTSNVMGAGTLDLEISDFDGPYGNTPVTAIFSSPANLAPGQTFTTDAVYLKNVGTMDIRWIWARFCNLVESNGVNTDAEIAADPSYTIKDISKYLKLVSVFESNDNGATYVETVFDAATANAFLGYWNSRGASFTLDGEISLNDLYVARDFGSGDKVTSLVLLNVVSDFGNPALPAGSVASFKFTFQLSEAVTNAYQGDTATFEVDFIGSHRDIYPDDELNESISETLGP
jgi:predicted ribosomally synthesized peptide with SipW-like signal peptide